ncbi:sugar transferase [Planctomicrobium sp. SH668]|uniref:sugar transferase n=1 Tax=Planctomicrobium sp. SH668 TaxID=3448126 RepID=UPI003F5CB8CC
MKFTGNNDVSTTPSVSADNRVERNSASPLLPEAMKIAPVSNLQDAVDFAEPQQFPDLWWLTILNNKETRNNITSLPASTRFFKRLIDIVVSATMLVVLSPLMLLVALLVKITSPGPVIFRQTRVGLNLRTPGPDRRQIQADAGPDGIDRRIPNSDRRVEFSYGRHFILYKFRTMRTDAEKNGAQFAVKGDSRITPIGRFLRKTRLDELPQLWNVLKGEMSLVGPRPERPEFIKGLSDEIPSYVDRLGLKPGLTGVAQILNGYDNEIESFRRKVAFDLHYLQNCSPTNDLKILVRTVGVVATGSGAL